MLTHGPRADVYLLGVHVSTCVSAINIPVEIFNHRLYYQIPYSGKLLREKTFAKMASIKILRRKLSRIRAIDQIWVACARMRCSWRKLSRTSTYPRNSRKFSRTKVSRYTVAHRNYVVSWRCLKWLYDFLKILWLLWHPNDWWLPSCISWCLFIIY